MSFDRMRQEFVAQASARDLSLQVNPNGNTLAWWLPAGKPEAPGILIGTALDSAQDGGAYDSGPSVVSAFAAIDALREQGFVPSGPLGVGYVVEADKALGCFIGLEPDHGRTLAQTGNDIGVGSGVWAHGRYRMHFTGSADDVQAAPMDERQDPMLTFAVTALAANKQARLTGDALARATVGRVEVSPNIAGMVPSSVTAWLDAHCPTDDELTELIASITRMAQQRADRDSTAVTISAESLSPAARFDPTLAAYVAGDRWPIIPTQVGHVAGVLQAAGVPSILLVMRDQSAVTALADIVQRLTDPDLSPLFM